MAAPTMRGFLYFLLILSFYGHSGFANYYPIREPSECELALLSTGELSLMARLQTLSNAKTSIRIRALIFTADETGLHIARILKQKAREGKKVIVMVDALSNLNLANQWMYYDLKMNGVEVEGFEIPWQIPLKKLINLPERNKRYHDKLWIIDAEDAEAAIAIGGGMNIANEYFQIGSERERLGRDQDFAVRGAIVGDMTSSFDRDYQIFKKDRESNPDVLNSDKTFPTWRKISNKILSLIEDTIGLRFGIPVLENKLNRAEVEAVQDDAAKLKLAFKPVKAQFIQSRPRYFETYIQDAYLSAIRSAQREIVIANAYFVPGDTLRAELKAAARRGVQVHILTNSRETNDLAQLSLVARSLYQDLLSAGENMHIYEFQGHRFLHTIHAKFGVFDGATSIVGSFNLDPRSELLNSETVIVFEDALLSASLRGDYFKHDLSNSVEITRKQAEEFMAPKDISDAILLQLSLPFKDQL